MRHTVRPTNLSARDLGHHRGRRAQRSSDRPVSVTPPHQREHPNSHAAGHLPGRAGLGSLKWCRARDWVLTIRASAAPARSPTAARNSATARSFGRCRCHPGRGKTTSPPHTTTASSRSWSGYQNPDAAENVSRSSPGRDRLMVRWRRCAITFHPTADTAALAYTAAKTL
jgi:hypothetical protein